MTIDDFELDVTALQELPETDPVDPAGVRLGDCLVTYCNIIATECNLLALTN